MAKSALGVEINMAAMMARNEKTRAVGNMRVNARGDLVDSNNNIITNANKRVENQYNQSVSDDGLGIAPTMAPDSTSNNMHNPGLTIDDSKHLTEEVELLPEEQELFSDINDEPEVKKK
jgi:hypothetical protein